MEAPSFTRRRLLKGAAGAVVLAGAGFGVDQLLQGSVAGSRAPRFRSRPDLSPPLTNVDVRARDTARGLIMLTAARTTKYQHGPLIVDNEGHVVWFSPVGQTTAVTNLQVQLYEGKRVLTWSEGKLVLPAGYGSGEYVILGSDYREVTRVRAGNGLTGDLHEFVITPRGTALFTVYDPVKRDLSAVGGASSGTLLNSLFQEVDIKTGKLLFQWSAMDHIDLSESYANAPAKAATDYDFFHINSIDVADDGNYIVSSRHCCAVYKLDSTTGEVLWRLNGKRSDFQMGPKTKFWYQHHARHHGNGVMTLFDDGAGLSNVEKVSRGLKLHVDEATMKATFLREYLPTPSVLADSQGSMQVLDDGNVFIGWGSAPWFSEHGAGGSLRFSTKIGAGSNSYRAFRSEWVGAPTESPAILAERTGAKDAATVYASWNGATNVSDWGVLAGASADSLSKVGSFAKHGFETPMQVHSAATYFAVEARDITGTVLARSRAVAVDSAA